MSGNRLATPVNLGILGIILLVVGIGIVSIHNPLRGSGLGTISIIAGVVLGVIAVSRRAK
jgi:hypothetical protein